MNTSAYETPRTMILTLATLERADTLILPASAAQLNRAQKVLEIDDFSEAVIAGIEYASPSLSRLIPAGTATVEDLNELAHCLQQIDAEGETAKYCAALEVERPSTFSEALDMAVNVDDYELVPEDGWEYGREALRRIGADDELLETVDGYTDFEQLGRAMMEEDGVRRTEFGLVRRLSSPFEEQLEMGQQMQ